MATSLLKNYEQLVEQINTEASEGGQLHALQALRDTAVTLENSTDGH